MTLSQVNKQSSQHQDIEEALLEWFKIHRNRNIIISGYHWAQFLLFPYPRTNCQYCHLKKKS